MVAALFLLLAIAAAPAETFTPLTADQLVFVNVDHAPMGAESTFAYGAKGDQCGIETTGAQRLHEGHGVLIALKTSSSLQAMPFLNSPASASSSAAFFADAVVQRRLGPGTDLWTVDNGALTWTHYAPVWTLANLASASPLEKQRFFLPATWMVFTVKNTSSDTEDFYFGLPEKGARKTFSADAYEGFSMGDAAVATKTGSCDVLTGNELSAALDGMKTGFAFHLGVPPGETRSLTVVIAHYRNALVDSRLAASCYYKTLFGSVDDVIDAATTILPDAQARCDALDAVMKKSGINVYRQFLASDALASYQACTLCVSDSSGNVYWRELEGDYENINTFDLTVDHCFFDSTIAPWALRNVLDVMSGAGGDEGYTYDHPLYDATGKTQVSPTGFSFHHDMGSGLTSDRPTLDPTVYEGFFSYMGQEQLQNWILCAGVYWKATGDNAWIKTNEPLLKKCLASMEIRDDVDPTKRDGITTNVNVREKNAQHNSIPEITTYDSLDASLQQPNLSARTTVRSWACYLALEAMFKQLGDADEAAACNDLAQKCAATIADRFNTYKNSLGYIPAFLDGSNKAATLPILEGLAYTDQMGMTDANDMTNGPYAAMLQALKEHTANILVPGKCLDAATGGWKLSSSTTNTWQSKVYLCQYVAEKVLGLTGDTVDGKVDQIHATFQMSQAPTQCWSDQFRSDNVGQATQSLHYPRGITSSLWWLTPATNPSSPVAGSKVGPR